VWLIIRKDQLSIIGLVSLYLTNYLILRGLIKQRFVSFLQDLARTVRRIPTPYAPVRHFVLNDSQQTEAETHSKRKAGRDDLSWDGSPLSF
jgi:hypothetical protein